MSESAARHRVRDTQRAFSQALRSAPALDDLLLYASPQLCQQVPTADAAHRLGLYRGNHVVHLTAALQASYPVLRALLGDTCFENVVRTYGQIHPPVQGDLAWAGAQLPDFLQAFAPLAALPYLADLARLEWRLALAYGAPDLPLVKAFKLDDLENAAIDVMRLQLRGGCGLSWINSQWPIAAIWQAHQGSDEKQISQALAAVDATRPMPPSTVAAWRDAENCLSVMTLDLNLLDLLTKVQAQPDAVWPFVEFAQAAAIGEHDYPCLAQAIAQDLLYLTLEPAHDVQP